MLPMVYVKQAITGTVDAAHAQERWLEVSCRFRSPMRRDESHDLTIAAGGTFALHAAAGSRAVLDGCFKTHGNLEPGVAVEHIDISVSEVRERLSRFAMSLPKIGALWIAVDS